LIASLETMQLMFESVAHGHFNKALCSNSLFYKEQKQNQNQNPSQKQRPAIWRRSLSFGKANHSWHHIN